MKRIISRQILEKAYNQPDDIEIEEDMNLKEIEDVVDKIPEEIFKIIGETISFLDMKDNKGETK